MQKKIFTVVEILEIMTFDRWLLLRELGKVKSFVLDSLIWYIEEETDPARKLSPHSWRAPSFVGEKAHCCEIIPVVMPCAVGKGWAAEPGCAPVHPSHPQTSALVTWLTWWALLNIGFYLFQSVVLIMVCDTQTLLWIFGHEFGMILEVVPTLWLHFFILSVNFLNS